MHHRRNQDVSRNLQRWVRWLWPQIGAVKLNVDGSSKGNPGMAGFGGVIRGDQGRWIVGFQGSLGIAGNLEAELMALYHGLHLAWSRDFRYVLCETDSKDVVRLVRETVDTHHLHHAILADIEEYINREWQISISHVLREANSCADFLARDGSSDQNLGVKIWEDPPTALRPLLLADRMGTCFLRI